MNLWQLIKLGVIIQKLIMLIINWMDSISIYYDVEVLTFYSKYLLSMWV